MLKPGQPSTNNCSQETCEGNQRFRWAEVCHRMGRERFVFDPNVPDRVVAQTSLACFFSGRDYLRLQHKPDHEQRTALR